MPKVNGKSIIDPIDRIEGHLRIEMEVENGVVKDAWVSGGLFRGLELIVEGREPTDAALVAQRICGVCPTSHCHASVYAAEAAYGIVHPEGARLVRNLLEGAQFLHSHILWFYQLSALDYVNPLNAVTGSDAAAEALGKKAVAFAEANGLAVRDYAAVAKRLNKFAAQGQYSWLSGGWFMEGQAPESYLLPPEVDLIATAHYIEGLDKQAVADEISAIIGGKMPHVMTSRPGGTAFYPNIERLDDILSRINELYDWVRTVLVPDAIAIAGVYKDTLLNGAFEAKDPSKLIGNNKHGRYMCYGVFDTKLKKGETEYSALAREIPAGIVVLNDKLQLEHEDFDYTKIEEQVAHSYYKDYSDGSDSKAPLEGETNPFQTAEEFPGYNTAEKYSWCKAPRYDGKPMEVGPLSRVLNSYVAGNEIIVKGVDTVVKALGLDPKTDLWCLTGSLGRLAARPVETLLVTELMKGWLNELVAYLSENEEPALFTEKARDTGEGIGLWEAPRGALLHCEKIENDKITHYQAVVPTAWNISPRDKDDVCGTIESALIGTPVNNLDAPINALRIVHGYDPCIACAIHVVEPKTGKESVMNYSPWGGR